MNAGFSNMTVLKAQLLGPTMAARPDWNDTVQSIGLGVAAGFANFCNRKFDRQANAQEVFAADRVRFLLERYPVESVSLIELKLSEKDGWQQLDAPPWDILQTIDQRAGALIFPNGNDAGPDYAQVRATYTGGYFWEQAEPSDKNLYPTAVPAGAALLPPDLFEAWIIQCRKVWEAFDKLGTKIVEVGSNTRQPSEALAGLDLVPLVKMKLQQFVRYQLT